MPNSQEVIFEVKHLKKWFPVAGSRGKKFVRAVNDVNLTLLKGETLGIVGESGCGKSTFARLMLRLIDATDGEVLLKGRNIMTLSSGEMRRARRDIQIVFQDPYASLNPRMKIGQILSEPYIVHQLCSTREAKGKAAELIKTVGLSEESLNKFPHEFSGGQRQRICIARALAVMPEIIVCDECVSALDVSIQAQIINMLKELQQKFGLTLVFISHDLRVVRHISDHIAVMYLGEVVEHAPKNELFVNPRHPYTQALLSAVPVADPGAVKERIMLKGELPSPIDRPSGCGFSTRCLYADENCRKERPGVYQIGADHNCRCIKVGGTLRT